MKKSFLWGFALLSSILCFLATGMPQTQKTPVVFFPGYVSTKLVVAVQNQTVAPECPASGAFESWIGSDQSNGFSPACRDKLMTLVYNHQPNLPMSERFSEQPGVTVTIKDYGKVDSSVGYDDLFAFLEAHGYSRSVNIRVAGYDWRLSPDIGDFLQRTIDLIEETYAENGNTPVHLVAHSGGPSYAQYLLTHTPQAWKNKYIQGFTPLAQCWPGQGMFYFVFFTGFNINDAMFPTDTETAKISALMFQSHPASYMLASDPAVFKNQEVVFQAGSTIYTPQHYRKLFRDARMALAEELGSYYIGFIRYQQPPYFPNVDVYAEKGSGLDTLVGLGLPNLTIGQLVDESTQYFFLPGDGNQEDITNNAVAVLGKMDCYRFEVNDNPGVFHSDIPSDPDVLGRLLMNLQRPRSVCSNH